MSEKISYRPEQVKTDYDHALILQSSMDKMAKDLTPITEEDASLQDQMRARGQESLDNALQKAKIYAGENAGSLQEQAKFEMESDLEHKKRTLAGFERAEEEIKNLPESDGPNN